jgi:hypothetical protein
LGFDESAGDIFAFVFAPEIGPDFSPGIPLPPKSGLLARDRLSLRANEVPKWNSLDLADGF